MLAHTKTSDLGLDLGGDLDLGDDLNLGDELDLDLGGPGLLSMSPALIYTNCKSNCLGGVSKAALSSNVIT